MNDVLNTRYSDASQTSFERYLNLYCIPAVSYDLRIFVSLRK